MKTLSLTSSWIRASWLAMSLGAALLSLPALAGKTLDAVKQRDQIVCGVNTGL